MTHTTHTYTSTLTRQPSDPLIHEIQYVPTEEKEGASSAVKTPKDYRTQRALPGSADHGSDGDHDGSSPEGSDGRPVRHGRNGGTRWLRGIDLADREEREAYGQPLRYTWRTFTGPAPVVGFGDTEAARLYLARLDAAADMGGWSTNEAGGLRLERKIWRARVAGEDARYNLVGNKPTGLDRQQTANVRDQQTVQAMIRKLKQGRSSGD